MRLIPLWLSRLLVLALLSCSAASAGEGELFTYTDSKTRGCFAHLAGNDWVEFAADGRVSYYQEVARNTNSISLSSNSLGVGVRLLGAKSEWKQGSKAPISRQGMFTRTVDLRPEFEPWPPAQTSRQPRHVLGIHQCGRLEFGLARKTRKSAILSVDFLNWASNEVAGNKDDGSIFSDCLAGFRRYGLCAESLMPYHTTSDPDRAPSPEAVKKAAALCREVGDSLQVHWILPYWNDEPGLSDRAFMEVKATLARGSRLPSVQVTAFCSSVFGTTHQRTAAASSSSKTRGNRPSGSFPMHMSKTNHTTCTGSTFSNRGHASGPGGSIQPGSSAGQTQATGWKPQKTVIVTNSMNELATPTMSSSTRIVVA